jgi:death-on-curing protein
MIYLNTADISRILEKHLPGMGIRDDGLIESALARPQASFAGHESYPTIELKAAALVQSIVGNHPLIDGNKRLGLICLIVFLGFNGFRLDATNDDAYDFIIAIASSQMRDLETIAEWITQHIAPYRD